MVEIIIRSKVGEGSETVLPLIRQFLTQKGFQVECKDANIYDFGMSEKNTQDRLSVIVESLQKKSQKQPFKIYLEECEIDFTGLPDTPSLGCTSNYPEESGYFWSTPKDRTTWMNGRPEIVYVYITESMQSVYRPGYVDPYPLEEFDSFYGPLLYPECFIVKDESCPINLSEKGSLTLKEGNPLEELVS